MSEPHDIQRLEEQRRTLLDALADLGDFRPGTLLSRYRKCGKPTCHCAREDDPGHGPKWVLVRSVDGGRRNWSIPEAALARTQAQVAEYRRFQRLLRELTDVSEGLCHARLTADREAGREVKKGASRSPSRRSSGTRSSA